VNIAVRNFQSKIPVDPKRIKRAILEVLSKKGAKKSGEITVCFVSDRKIRELNKKFLHKDSPTDVLVFPMPREGRLFADIVISVDTAVRNARIFKTRVSGELSLYAVHGALHLAGYDDKTTKQRQIMRKKERQYVHT